MKMRKLCSRCNRFRAATAGCALFWLFAVMTSVAQAWDGELDTGFAGDGIVAILMGSGNSSGQGVAIQADGTYVLVGVATDSNEDFGLARVTPIGSMDPSFGTSGKVYWDSGWGNDGGWDVAVQDDGKIVVVGFTDVNTAIAVARLNAAGVLDLSFDGDGKTTVDFEEGPDEGWDLALQPDGKIIVVGSAVVDGMLKCVVLRFLEGGSRDKFGPEPSGSSQGYVAFDFMGDSRVRGVVLLPNAKIVVVGDAVAAQGRYVYLAARLNIPSLEIFTDGFESGNTLAWSSTIP